MKSKVAVLRVTPETIFKDIDRLVTLQVDAALNGYSTERLKTFYNQALDNIRSTPGVKAAGFAFIPDAADVFVATVQRALTLYRDDPARWLQLLRTGMRQDWSWQRSAGEYEALYQRLREMK